MTETITLEQWGAQWPGLRKASRALWMAIRWEFQEQEPPMTVRQMFYRMSALGMVPKAEAGYRKVQYALANMRRAGAIPFSWIADNTRWVQPETFGSLADMLFQQQQFYRRDLWATQPDHVEIWLEKDALAGVVDAVTSLYAVPLYVTRGYSSLTYLHTAAEALEGITKPIYIYHFGDFDASGKDAARSIREGLHGFGARFHFQEIAVTDEQIGMMQLQTRPAKKKDPRARKWGAYAVELDAIPPATLRRLVQATIERHIDRGELERLQTIEKSERETLAGLAAAFGTSTNSGGVAND